MPTYQYACTSADCRHEFEQFQAFTDPTLTDCPACGQRVRKVYGSVGVVFKGSGFYRTDSRDSKTSSSSGSGSSDAAKDSKSESSASKNEKSKAADNGSSNGTKGSTGSSTSGTAGNSAPAKATVAS